MLILSCCITRATSLSKDVKPLSHRLKEKIQEVSIKIIRILGDCLVEPLFLAADLIKKYTYYPIKEKLYFIENQKQEAVITAYYLKVIGLVLASLGLFFGSLAIVSLNSAFLFPVHTLMTVAIGLYARDFFKISQNLIKYAASPWLTFDAMCQKSFWDGKAIFVDVFVVNKSMAQFFRNNFVLLVEVFKATS